MDGLERDTGSRWRVRRHYKPSTEINQSFVLNFPSFAEKYSNLALQTLCIPTSVGTKIPLAMVPFQESRHSIRPFGQSTSLRIVLTLTSLETSSSLKCACDEKEENYRLCISKLHVFVGYFTAKCSSYIYKLSLNREAMKIIYVYVLTGWLTRAEVPSICTMTCSLIWGLGLTHWK